MNNKKINTYRGAVLSWECDEIGHMNVMYYVNKFELAGRYLNGCLGMSKQVLDNHNWGTTVVRQEINYHQEVFSGTLLYANSSIIEIGNKSYVSFHELRNAETNTLISTARNTVVIFDLKTRKAVYLPEFVRLKLEEMIG
jgi:acyl-CoA thioester hydrolase